MRLPYAVIKVFVSSCILSVFLPPFSLSHFGLISVPLHHVTVFHVHHPHLGGVWQRRAQHAQRKDLLRRRHDDWL